MSRFSSVEIAGVVLVIVALAIPVLFSYTAIRRRRTIGRVFLEWRPASARLVMMLWSVCGIIVAVFMYNYSAHPFARLIFIAAFFSGLMNTLGNKILIGEKGIFVNRLPIPWNEITEFSTWDRGGKHFMSVTWSEATSSDKNKKASFVIPQRMVKAAIALFQNFIPSIQLPRSN